MFLQWYSPREVVDIPVPSTLVAAKKYLQFHFQVIGCPLPLASTGTTYIWCIDIHTGKTLTYLELE